MRYGQINFVGCIAQILTIRVVYVKWLDVLMNDIYLIMKISFNGNKLVRNISAHFIIYISMVRKKNNSSRKLPNQML